MYFEQLNLENWRNFRSASATLQRRVFVIGPNASGKSNFLDAFRFLRDLADPQGGLQRAVDQRGGVSAIRCLHARQHSNITIDITMMIDGTRWAYRLELGGGKKAVVKREVVTRGGKTLLSRPNDQDEHDESLLTQTHLEQVSANKEFRDVAKALATVRYLHVVPQLIRDSGRVLPRSHDPYGSDFLEQMVATRKKILESRLKRISAAISVAVPQLSSIIPFRDNRGAPHLRVLYEHWRPQGAWQTEEQLSDGTLRLLGLLWAVLDGDAPLLLEEPELSLHSAVVRFIPTLMARAARGDGRQLIISTHSDDLLADEGVAPEEIIILEPTSDGTVLTVAADDEEVQALREGGMGVADAVIPRSAPKHADQLALFGD